MGHVFGSDFDPIKQQLHISSSQFRQLDKLDGNEDLQIEESIFNCAKWIRNGDSDVDHSEVDVNLWKKVADVLQQGVTNWLKPNLNNYSKDKISIDSTFLEREDGTSHVSSPSVIDAQPDSIEFILREKAIKALEHYLKYGNLDSFKTQADRVGAYGVLNSDATLSFEVEFSYEDMENDVIYNNRTDRTADKIAIAITFRTEEGETLQFKQYFKLDSREIAKDYKASEKNGKAMGKNLYNAVNDIGAEKTRQYLKNPAFTSKEHIVELINTFNNLSKENGIDDGIMTRLTKKWGPTREEMNSIPTSLLEAAKDLGLDLSIEYENLQILLDNSSRGESWTGDYTKEYAKDLDKAIENLMQLIKDSNFAI